MRIQIVASRGGDQVLADGIMLVGQLFELSGGGGGSIHVPVFLSKPTSL